MTEREKDVPRYQYIEKYLAEFWDGPDRDATQHRRMFQKMSEDGWEFCGLEPAQHHRIPEHSKPAIFFFRRPAAFLNGERASK